MNKVKFELYQYQFACADLELGELPLRSKTALETIMIEDYLRESRFEFACAKNNLDFTHEYMWIPEPNGVVSVFKFGYNRHTNVDKSHWSLKKKMEFPHCVIVLSLKLSSPYILVWDFEKAFKNADEVAGLLVKALNGNFKGRGISISISSCVKNEEAKHWMDYMFKVYKKARKHKESSIVELEKYEKIKLHQEPSDFRSCVIDPDKADQVISMLHKYMKYKTEAMDLFMPVLAAVEAEAIIKPSWAEISAEFLLSNSYESSYYRIVRQGCKTYSKVVFDKMVAVFRSI